MPVNFGDAHGTAGIIQHIQDTYVLVVDQNNMEKTIVINEHTIIKKERETISSKDLREGDAIVVIGDPNDQAFIDANWCVLFLRPILEMCYLAKIFRSLIQGIKYRASL
jgi:hypothetical protein